MTKTAEHNSAEVAARAPRHPERALAEEQLQTFRQLHTSTTELAAALRGGIMNSVLGAEVAQFDASGQLTRSYNVPIGSVAVTNHTTTDVTVSNGPPQGSAPGGGPGQGLVSSRTFAVLNVGASRDLTLYGPAGGTITLQVFTRPQPPHVASIGGGPAATAPTVVNSGRATVTTAGTRIQLPANAAVGVTITPWRTNTGLIYVGGSAVAAVVSMGLPAAVGVSFDIGNTGAIWLDASVSGEGADYLWVL